MPTEIRDPLYHARSIRENEFARHLHRRRSSFMPTEREKGKAKRACDRGITPAEYLRPTKKTKNEGIAELRTATYKYYDMDHLDRVNEYLKAKIKALEKQNQRLEAVFSELQLHLPPGIARAVFKSVLRREEAEDDAKAIASAATGYNGLILENTAESDMALHMWSPLHNERPSVGHARPTPFPEMAALAMMARSSSSLRRVTPVYAPAANPASLSVETISSEKSDAFARPVTSLAENLTALQGTTPVTPSMEDDGGRNDDSDVDDEDTEDEEEVYIMKKAYKREEDAEVTAVQSSQTTLKAQKGGRRQLLEENRELVF